MAEECRKCSEKRPASLRQKAEEFKQSDVGQARKATKRGRKKAARTWTEAQWAQYQAEELDKAERGSVMSSNLADDTTIASTLDVVDMEDFRDSWRPIEEETEAPWRNWRGSAG